MSKTFARAYAQKILDKQKDIEALRWKSEEHAQGKLQESPISGFLLLIGFSIGIILPITYNHLTGL